MSDVGIVVDLDDQTIEQSKVVLDYTSRDYVAIRSQLVGLAKGFMPDWQTAGEAGDMGTLILELFAYMGDVLHFYIDRTASEAFLGTAVRQQSILYIADMMGYTPIGQQAASVELTFRLLADDPDNKGSIVPITIPRGTRLYNSAGNADEVVIFEMDSEVTLNPGDSKIGYASEGITVESYSLGLCQGVPNTEFVIPDKGVIFGTVRVQTREGYQIVNWTSYHHLATARPTQAVFTTFLDESGYTHIVFGDNSSGRIPPVNAEAFVDYRFGRGALANTLAANTVDTIAPITDVDTFGLSVTNPASPVGGSDPESVDSMRYTISRGGTRIRDRAVTLADYADLAMQVPGVSKSVAYGTVYTAVWVKIAPPDGQANTDYMAKLCNSVEAYLIDKIMIGSSVRAVPLDPAELWQDIYIQITVHVQDAYNRTTVRLQTDSVVRSLLAFNAVDFGYRVSVGAIYRAVLAVQGVSYAEIDWLSTAAPVDDTDPENGDTAQVARAVWRNDTTPDTTTNPGPGDVRRNVLANPTIFAVSSTGSDGSAVNVAGLQVGDHLVVSPVDDPTSWQSFILTIAPVSLTTGGSTWYQLNVLRIDQAAVVNPPGNNKGVLFSALRYTPTPDSLGGVNDIITDELLIPRIAPTPPILSADVTTSSLTSNVALLTTALPHGMSVGQLVDVTGVDPAGTTPPVFNGRQTLIAISTAPEVAATSLGYAVTHANIASAPISPVGTITTVNPPESETDYPDMTEDERTHDGLWVKALGGLPNT